MIWAQSGQNLRNLISQTTVSHDWLSKNFEMQYDGVQQLAQSNISQFAKKSSLSAKGQFGSSLSLSHDSLSENIFEVLCHDEALDKSSLSHFSKKFPFWAIQAHLAENYTTNCSRDFQKHSSIMWCNSQTLVIFVTFLERFLYQTSGNSGKNGATLFS